MCVSEFNLHAVCLFFQIAWHIFYEILDAVFHLWGNTICFNRLICTDTVFQPLCLSMWSCMCLFCNCWCHECVHWHRHIRDETVLIPTGTWCYSSWKKHKHSVGLNSFYEMNYVRHGRFLTASNLIHFTKWINSDRKYPVVIFQSELSPTEYFCTFS